MKNVIWKAHEMSTIFERSTKLALGINQKSLTLSENKDNENNVALISASRNGSGRVGYIHLNKEDKENVSINKLTFDDQWGYTYFQKENFVITGGHNAILEIVIPKLKDVLDKNLFCYDFLSIIINKITLKSNIFGYGYKINNKFDREIILLPCIEVDKNKEYIWEENGKYYTLAVEYIKELMEEAKELREQKTIRLYEAEKKKYEAEKKKYEAEYLKEKNKVVWKGYELGEIFTTSTEHYLEKSKKNYNLSDVKTDDYPVAVCSASKQNNGIVGYISLVDDVPIKKRKGFITKGGFGHFYYQDDWFIKPGGSWGMLDIVKFKNDDLKKVFDNDKTLYLWISKVLTKMFTSLSTWGYSVPFDREIILLPCIEVDKNEEYIWEENGKYYTLATNFISYIYLQGRCNHYQKLIDTYTYKI